MHSHGNLTPNGQKALVIITEHDGNIRAENLRDAVRICSVPPKVIEDALDSGNSFKSVFGNTCVDYLEG